MVRQIERFREILSERGIKSALADTYHYLTPHDFVRETLLVVEPATIPHAIYVKLYEPILEWKIGSGIDIMKQDWDNLILLDAYRADYFREYSSLDGELSQVVSRGNWSLDFIANNFAGEEYHDTVVVTANPHYQKGPYVDESTFHTLINPSGVDNRVEASPEQVTQAARSAHEEFPNKRLIIHYMQPHAPHMGETSERFREAFGDESFRGQLMFKLYKSGMISKETLQQSYRDTIAVVESEVQRLTADLDGKTVVSADHGENLGEVQHGMVQLKHGNPTPECRYVPWLEMEDKGRKDVTAEEPIGFETLDRETLDDRLAALGYK